jgi:hypothetical protein
MAKILIMERVGNDVFVYREDLRHHAAVQENVASNARSVSQRVDVEVFDDECNVMKVLEDGQWTSMVIL